MLGPGEDDNQVLVRAKGVIIGQVNRRAAAILAPLLQADLIDVQIQQNQAADGQVGKALYIFAKLGVEGREQVVFQAESDGRHCAICRAFSGVEGW